MRVHCLQHVAFEGLGAIGPFLEANGHRVDYTRFYHQRPRLPGMGDLDALVVLGGPMSVHDIAAYPWLEAELDFITRWLKTGKPCLGICLGAQLMAKALGARVYPAEQREIGWHRIEWVGQGAFGLEAGRVETVFQWHGETFDLPSAARLVASSPACTHQGFLLGDRALGLQFHLEASPASVELLLEHCADDIVAGAYVQGPIEIRRGTDIHYRRANSMLEGLLSLLLAGE